MTLHFIYKCEKSIIFFMLSFASQRLQEQFLSSFRNNQQQSSPGKKKMHIDWQVVLGGTEGVGRNDDEGINVFHEFSFWTAPGCL